MAAADPPGAPTVTPAGPDGPAARDAAPAVDQPAPRAGVVPVVKGDWLASVCPYLTSEDGTYRSAAPDEGHRCTAQDPAASLPLAFQERFCLTDRHPRCEMYKYAQETDTSGRIPADRVPPTDPPASSARGTGGGGPSRPLLATLAGIAGLVIVVLLVMVMGSCSGDGEPTADPDRTPDEQATEAPVSGRDPTPRPTAQAEDTATPDSDPEATPDGAAGETVFIL